MTISVIIKNADSGELSKDRAILITRPDSKNGAGDIIRAGQEMHLHVWKESDLIIKEISV